MDGGHPLPRAKIKLNLLGIVPDAQHVSGLEGLLTRELTLDLFEHPPEREQIREEVVRLTAQGRTQRQIASQLPDKTPQPVVQLSLALQNKMNELGQTTPFVILREPPDRLCQTPTAQIQSITSSHWKATSDQSFNQLFNNPNFI